MSKITTADYLAMEARLKKGKPPVPSDAVECESALQDDIEAYLRGRGWFYTRSRMDRATTNRLGTPDFIIAIPRGRTLWLECKSKTGKFSTEQMGIKLILQRDGHWWAEARSLEQFLDLVKGF